MDWNYFIEDGKFKARRLPPPKCAVKIKDVSDLSDLRSELRNSYSIEQAKKAYAFFCDWHEVEIETFEEFLSRNPKGLLSDSTGLLTDQFLLIDLLSLSDDQGVPDGWLAIEEKTCLKLVENGLVRIKPSVSDVEWLDHYSNKYTVKDLDRLSKRWDLELKGKKDEKLSTLLEAIKSQKTTLAKIFFVKPSENFQQWYEALERQYIEEIETGLKAFDYPKSFHRDIWQEVLIDDLSENTKTYIKSQYATLLEQKKVATPSTRQASMTKGTQANQTDTAKTLSLKSLFALLIGMALLLWIFF
jgi:hypothetical protein